MSDALTPQEMLDHFNVHAKAEFEGDIDLTMETVCENPHYEWPALDIELNGADAVREFYLRFMRNLIPYMKGGGRRMYAFGENAIWQESIFDIEGEDGGLTKASSLTIARFQTDPVKISGEHSYGSASFNKFAGKALGGDDIYDVPGITRVDLSKIELLPVEYIGVEA